MSTLHTFKSVRRRKLALTALALLASAPVVQAQSSGSYPNRPIRLVVGYPPGGSSDATARLLGAALSIKLGQPVIIDNKPGANTAIAAQYAKTQPVFKNPQCHPLEGPTEKPESGWSPHELGLCQKKRPSHCEGLDILAEREGFETTGILNKLLHSTIFIMLNHIVRPN